ncbi:MAG: type II/IV secretion system ATPase subunit [Candidatus Pacearchaeota archaeon]
MRFKEDAPFSTEVIRIEGENVLFINFMGVDYVPSLIKSPELMDRIIDILIKNPNISRMVFVQYKNYNFNFEQVSTLMEIGEFYEFLTKKKKILSSATLSIIKNPQRAFNFFTNFLINYLKKDPVLAYKLLEEEKNFVEREDENYYNILESIYEKFSKLKIIIKLKEYLKDDTIKGREIYTKIFSPEITPNFVFTRIISKIPEKLEIIDEYKIGKKLDFGEVMILKDKENARFIYHLSCPEYNLKENHEILLNNAKKILSEHKPTNEEFNDFERTRQVFLNIARDMLKDLSTSQGIELNFLELESLSYILVRHTIGFGILEILLEDENIQDIIINSPTSSSPIFVKHNKFDECATNIYVSHEDVESWAAKFRMLSGRALDEAHPILDCSLNLETASARVAIIQKPLSTSGISYSLRRHRDKPWTLPLFIKNKMLNSLSAGLLSFLIDGARTILVAGTRSSGKTSLLGSLMLEIMPKYRIITIEDTLELPVNQMKKLGYDILSMKVRSALTGESNEVSAEEGIRASLRLGDSALIVGEIRSDEAKALYEAMRVGALANVVAGTIHGASPYGVFDRVVNDLNVPITSFKATDCIIIVNPIKTPDGLRSYKRLLQITEVRKHWNKDPLEEGGFVDLMKYEVEKDILIPTEDMINGDSEIIKSIASNVKGWAGDWEAVWENIILRQKIKEEIVALSERTKIDELLEANFVVKSNNAFHEISEEVKEEIGSLNSKDIFSKWKDWLEKESKKIK